MRGFVLLSVLKVLKNVIMHFIYKTLQMLVNRLRDGKEKELFESITPHFKHLMSHFLAQ